MTTSEQLDVAFTGLLAKLSEYAQNPKPSYSIEGQSVSYTEYLKMLIEGIKTVNELRVMFNPFELRSIVQ